jgi:hypothetical protein
MSLKPLSEGEYRALREIPVWEVLHLKMGGAEWRLISDGRPAYLAEIDALGEPLRSLRLVVELMRYSGLVVDQPESGLRGFFLSAEGGLAPEVLQALRNAGLDRRAAVFEAAMACFPQPYPLDYSERTALLAKHLRIDSDGVLHDAEPTELDLSLIELGESFGSNAGLKEEIDAFVARDPTLTRYAAKARAALSDVERMTFLIYAIHKVVGADLQRLPTPYRAIALIGLLEAEVANGGLHQYFFNGEGDQAETTRAVLKQMSLDAHAAILEKALAMFPTPFPADVEERRRRCFEHRWNGWDDALQALSDGFDYDALQGGLLAYAKREDALPR